MVAVTDSARTAHTRFFLSEATGEVHWNAVVAGVVVAPFLPLSAGPAGLFVRLAGPLAAQGPTQHAVAVGAIWAFVALLIGAAAALLAGYLGAGFVRRLGVSSARVVTS